MTTDEPRRPSARATALVDDLRALAYGLGWQDKAIGKEEQPPRELEVLRKRTDLLVYLADLEAARDALAFYADPAHYGDTAKRIITADGSFANVCSVLADGGARARATRAVPS